MKIAIINTVSSKKSTGKIAYGLQQYMQAQGYSATIFYGREVEGKEDKPNMVRVGNDLDMRIHAGMARVFGGQGTYSYFATKKMLRQFEEMGIEAVCLLNLHGYYLNFPLLFKWLGKNKVRVIYVMLDEYPFLGKCTYSFECNKFKTKCEKCPHLHDYPKSLFVDCSSRVFNLKKKAYAQVPQCIFVGIEYSVQRAKESALLQNARFAIADEAIDLRKQYYPRDTKNLRKKLGIADNKVIILTVAPYPDDRKGGIHFLNAAKLLSNKKNLVFVHVGFQADHSICPENYIPIGYVSNQDELAEYYSMGDLFVQTSSAETIPAACLEALACGTPILGFNISGIPYCADKEHGTFVKPNSAEALAEVIEKTHKKTEEMRNSCRKYAESRYDSTLYQKKLTDLLISEELLY